MDFVKRLSQKSLLDLLFLYSESQTTLSQIICPHFVLGRLTPWLARLLLMYMLSAHKIQATYYQTVCEIQQNASHLH